MSSGLTLLTFAPMIDSETSRLVLRHYMVDYREEPHAPVWGSALALLRAGSVQVPVLYGNGLRLAGPRAIIDRFEAVQPPGRALLPADPGLRATVEADWDLFHGTLADKTALLAYYHLLPHPDILIEPFTRGIPASEVPAVRMAYPLLRRFLTTALRLTDANARDALRQIRAIFDQTDARVGDGRRTLLGERLALGDLGARRRRHARAAARGQWLTRSAAGADAARLRRDRRGNADPSDGRLCAGRLPRTRGQSASDYAIGAGPEPSSRTTRGSVRPCTTIVNTTTA